jgi:hypothetical protein
MTLKKYTISVTEAQYWGEIHNVLVEDSNEDGIPDRKVTCSDYKEHSPTRGTFLLHGNEAQEIANHPHVEWIELDPTEYKDQYPKPEFHIKRWNKNVKVYRDLNGGGQPVTTGPTSAELDRTGWQIPRTGIKTNSDFWGILTGNIAAQSGDASYSLTGKNVDVIIHDSGILASHPEFLDENGVSRVRDVVLDGPYYIDPDFFNAPLDIVWNGPIVNVVGDGSDFFKRELTVNGVRIMGAGTVGGQTAVPDAWLEKVGRMFELFTDPSGPAGVATVGINTTFQRELINTLHGNVGTYHSGFPTIQRVARGAGSDYSTNFLTDEGVVFWNLTNLFDTHVQNDMVWYLNSTGSGYGDGDLDAQEVIEHVFHTLHMHGLPAEDIKLYPFLAPDWADGDLYAAMEEAYDAGKWDPSGYEPSPGAFKTNADAYEVAAKEYLYLLNFCMFEYTELWEGGSLAPEWTDDMRTQLGIQANNPLGYAFFNTWMAPVITKPSLTTIRNIFQDGNTPDQDDPSLAGASGYVVDDNGRTYTRWDGRVGCTTTTAHSWWQNGANRSVGFSTIGTVNVDSGYTATRAIGVGSDGSNSMSSGHGTSCASLVGGKNFGLSFECNLWNMSGIGEPAAMNISIEQNYDLMKLFHVYKPVNPETGRKNPTVINGSWGYNAAFASGDTVSYKYKGSTGTFTGNATAVADSITALKEGIYGSSYFGQYRSWSTSSRSNSTDTAGNEMMDTGVIYVAAAGNSNLYLGIGSTDPHRLNYMSDIYFGTTDPRPDFPAGTVPCSHRDWMNPQGIGFNSTTDPEFHPVICVGAMDEYVLLGTEGYAAQYAERKANYSNNGPGIDVWSPADETLAAGTNGVGGYTDYQRYDDTRFYDNYFNGTSAAAPVASGLIALYIQTNPSATSRDVQKWIREHGSVGVSTLAYADAYPDPSVVQYWTGDFNMRGAERRILYNPFANDTVPRIEGLNLEGVDIKII